MSGEHQEKSTKAKVAALKTKAKANAGPLLGKRHAKRDKLPHITTAAITKLGRRAGIPCFSEKSGIFDEARDVIDYWLDLVVKDAVLMAQHSHRKTIFTKDVMYALRRHNRPLYDIHG
jgi:histone H3/H4